MDADAIARNAKLARLRAGFDTHEKAARAIGCSRTLVIAWETTGTSLKGSKYLLDAARAYRVDPTWLATGIGPDGYENAPEPAISDLDANQSIAQFRQTQEELRAALLAVSRVLAETIPTAGRAMEAELAKLPEGRYLELLLGIVRRENAKRDVADADARVRKARGAAKHSHST